MHSQSCEPILCLLLTTREVLSLPVKISPYNQALSNSLPQADLGKSFLRFPNLQYHTDCPWKLGTASQGHLGSGEVSPHLATCQTASSWPLATGRCCCFCWPPQHQLSNWPVQFLWTIFSYSLGISDQHKGSWKLPWCVPVLKIATTLKGKLRLGSSCETTLFSREI